jgi:uncharacterized protein (DUF433 family)
MTATTSYPHLVKADGEPARLVRLPRIRVAQIVMDYLNHGWSADEICIHYPHLRLAEVHSAMAYYFDHQAEVDAEIEEEQEAIQQSQANAKPTAIELRLRALVHGQSGMEVRSQSKSPPGPFTGLSAQR